MRKVVRTGIVLSALLAWNVISVAQNTTPQQQPAQQSQTQVAQPTGNAAAGATPESGTVVGPTSAFGGLTTAGLIALGLVGFVVFAAITQNKDTTPSVPPTATTTR